MGMHDDVRVEYPMPDPRFQNRLFQTKSSPNEYPACELFTILATGRLMRRFWVSGGMDVPVVWGIEPVVGWDGEMEFYDWENEYTGHWRVDEGGGLHYFLATFKDGLCVSIEDGKHRSL